MQGPASASKLILEEFSGADVDDCIRVKAMVVVTYDTCSCDYASTLVWVSASPKFPFPHRYHRVWNIQSSPRAHGYWLSLPSQM